MGSIFRNRIIMKVFVIVAIFVAVLDGRRQREEPVPMAGCDPDFGWVDGADGSGKCYQLIKDVTFARCGVDAYEQGMAWCKRSSQRRNLYQPKWSTFCLHKLDGWRTQ